LGKFELKGNRREREIRSPVRSLSFPQEVLNQEVPENKCKLVYHHVKFLRNGGRGRWKEAHMISTFFSNLCSDMSTLDIQRAIPVAGCSFWVHLSLELK
jgi:hypothetical protein